MITSLETTREDLVATRLSGTLDRVDYDLMVPVLESKINQYGKIDLYWEMDGVTGWQPGKI